MILNCYWASNMTSIFFYNSEFSLIDSSGKRVFEAECGKEDGGQDD